MLPAYTWISGWWFANILSTFSKNIANNQTNWRTRGFCSEGWRKTTNQLSLCLHFGFCGKVQTRFWSKLASQKGQLSWGFRAIAEYFGKPWIARTWAGWWFGCHQFYFSHSYWVSVIIAIDELIFFRGVAKNHQPVEILEPITIANGPTNSGDIFSRGISDGPSRFWKNA